MAARVAEEAPHARGADAGVHLDEVGSAGEQERHTGFARDRAREQRLAGAGRPDQQDTAGNPAAERRVAARLAQEVDDLLDLVLRLVHAGDVLEGDDVVAALGDARPRRHRRDAAGGRAIDGEAEQPQEGGRGGQGRSS